MRLSKLLLTGTAILVLAAGSARLARAEDPATKTLPDSASDTAKANAFGQQGARMKALHQAATAAAAADAHKTSDELKAEAAAHAAAGKAHSQGATHSADGQATASDARGDHGPATIPSPTPGPGSHGTSGSVPAPGDAGKSGAHRP